ncbi:DUF4189 domain-containing protein [Nocardia bhagyanarayanae]|uniref:Uncharacterized protein DUF4189 n=1 Tax=Nocardia bhagyanarayanae TaxID=1215925 RepID=A0A543F7G0_9NOCA|nr:DUF4189 domain-containing protein [Nocardia bhagyanarayanae]TQM29767.1 uncharacterized protein DUF4189 [Nocardia bhagyanarayanae]
MKNSAPRSAARLARWGIVAAAVGVAMTVPQATASADATRYAAIALSTSTGETGSAWNYPSSGEAVDAAVGACNSRVPVVHHPPTGSSGPYTTGGDCAWQIWLPSGYCGALVQSTSYNAKTDTWGSVEYTTGSGRTREEAVYNAIQIGTGYRTQILESLCQD